MERVPIEEEMAPECPGDPGLLPVPPFLQALVLHSATGFRRRTHFKPTVHRDGFPLLAEGGVSRSCSRAPTRSSDVRLAVGAFCWARSFPKPPDRRGQSYPVVCFGGRPLTPIPSLPLFAAPLPHRTCVHAPLPLDGGRVWAKQ